jgi:hypothetical protein
MWLRIISTITLAAFVTCLLGCTKVVSKFPDEAIKHDDRIISIMKKDGNRVNFDRNGGMYNPETESIMGMTEDSTAVEIPKGDIQYIDLEKPDGFGTAMLATTVGFSIVVLAVVILANAFGD